MNRNPAFEFSTTRLGTLLAVLYAVLAWPALSSQPTSLNVIVVSIPLGVALVALSFFDIKEFRLPDLITLPLIVAGLLVTVTFGWSDPIWHGIAAVAGYGSFYAIGEVYQRLRGHAGLGLGDAKLFAAAGAWLGLEPLPSVLLWATGAALAGVLVASALQHRISATSPIPFGPALALGFWLVWLYGPLI